MSSPPFNPLNGHCTCHTITYTITAPPLIINCCHCTACQRESGSAFALNAVIECYNFAITSATQPSIKGIPSLSSPEGEKHLVATCPQCRTALFAHYGANTSMIYVKAGTLEDASRKGIRPDAHIFTGTKLEWVDLSAEKERGIGVFENYYVREETWRKESLERREKLVEWAETQKKD